MAMPGLLRRVGVILGVPPLVIASSSAEQEDIDLGFNAYVRKPVVFGAFSKAVSGLGLFRLPSNESPSALG